jgi:hypothetical protein
MWRFLVLATVIVIGIIAIPAAFSLHPSVVDVPVVPALLAGLALLAIGLVYRTRAGAGWGPMIVAVLGLLSLTLGAVRAARPG